MIETTAEVLFKMTYLTHIVASYGGLGMLRICCYARDVSPSLAPPSACQNSSMEEFASRQTCDLSAPQRGSKRRPKRAKHTPEPSLSPRCRRRSLHLLHRDKFQVVGSRTHTRQLRVAFC